MHIKRILASKHDQHDQRWKRVNLCHFKNGWWSVNVIHYKLDVRFLRMRAAYFLIVLLSSDSGLMGFSSKPPPHRTSVARKVLGGYNIKTTRFGQWYLISIWPLIDICTCYKTQWKQSWVLRVPYTNVILKVGYIDGLVECPLGTALQPKLEGTRKLLGPNQDCSSIAWSSENTEQRKEQGKVILYIHGSFAFIDTIFKSKRKA